MLFYSIIDIGTCIQHTVHRLVKTAFDKSNTKIKETLKGGFQLLHNSAASREDYESVSGPSKYPFHYCPTQWLENKLFVKV